MHISVTTIGIALSLSLCGAAAAQTYKWVDANGRIQYSDKPPTGNVKVEEIKRSVGTVSGGAKADSANGNKSAASSAPKSVAEQEQAFRKRQMDGQEEAQKQAKNEAEAKAKEEQCQRARGMVASLEASGRHVRFDAKGERYFLDDNEIEKERAKARASLASLCK